MKAIESGEEKILEGVIVDSPDTWPPREERPGFRARLYTDPVDVVFPPERTSDEIKYMLRHRFAGSLINPKNITWVSGTF